MEQQHSIAEFYYNEIIISAAMEPAQFFSFTDVPEGFFLIFFMIILPRCEANFCQGGSFPRCHRCLESRKTFSCSRVGGAGEALKLRIRDKIANNCGKRATHFPF
jgi:hypothetical protein